MGFLKLEFAKANDTVSWEFRLQPMVAVGIHTTFIDMAKLLF